MRSNCVTLSVFVVVIVLAVFDVDTEYHHGGACGSERDF